MDFKIRGCLEEKRYDLLLLTGNSMGYILEVFAVLFIEVEYKDVKSVAGLIFEIFGRLGGRAPKVLVTPSDNYYNQLITEM